MSLRELFEFDSYRLDPAERLLLRDGVAVPLEPKVFETLVVLIRGGGRLVTKDQLMKEVWPDTFVEESNLVRHISILRKALSRGDDEPPYIETVSKLGYRFVGNMRPPAIEQTEVIVESAKVSVIVEEELDGSARRVSPTLDTHRPLNSAKWRWWAAGSTLAIVAIGVVATASYFRVFSSHTHEIDSVAILPFVNVGASPEMEYLSDGITENLTNSLSRLSGLKVMSRNSVVRYKGAETNAQQAGIALGVRSVLVGNVTQRGDDLIVTAELVDVRDNSRLWGNSYDRKLADLQAVQIELAREISQQLGRTLSGEAQQRLSQPATQDHEAYDLYLKGRHALNNLTRQQQSGLGYFEQAVARDPDYALAYAGMAESYVLMADLGATFKIPPKDAYRQAKAAALRAVEIDETLAEAHVSLGRVAFNYEWDWAGAEREFKRAIALKPASVPAHHWYSHLLISQGRFDESLQESLRALALDPLDVAMNFHLGFHYWNARQYDQAAAQLKKTLTMDPNHHETHGILGLVYVQQQRYPEAITEWQKSVELGGWDKRGFLGYVYAVSGRRVEAQDLLDQLLKEAKSEPVSAYNIARIYTGLAEKEQAFSWLERAIAEHDSNLTMPGLKSDVQLDTLRSDPRFEGLLRRMRLP